MAKTFLQRNVSYYDRLIKEAENSPYAQNYQKVCNALKALVETTNKLRDKNHKMSTEEYKELTDRYNNVQSVCEEYANNKDNFDDFEKKRSGIVKDISSVVKKDMDVLLKCDHLNPGSLSEIMEKSRTHTIVLDKDSIKKAGGAQSTRWPIKTISGKKGFFTPKTVFNLDKEWEKGVEKYEQFFAGIGKDKVVEKLKLLKTDEKFQEEFSRYVPYEKVTTKNGRRENFGKLCRLATLLGVYPSEREASDNLLRENNFPFYSKFVQFVDEFRDVANRQRIMTGTGIKKGDSISTRNCAMTEVAKMLKCRNLLANSVPMKIVVDGKTIEGVFMESAEGSDLKCLEKDDPLTMANKASFQTPEATQQLIDLQVLDFVCGNTDRHRGNMFYKFEGNKPGKVKLVGIQGIDNDCAFGTPDLSKRNQIMHLVHPDNMKYISKPMLLNLGLLTKEKLEFNLAHYDLSKDQIAAVWDRVQMVRTAVEKNKIRVIDKDFWKKNPMGKTEYKDNYLATMNELAEECEKGEKRANASDQKRISYAKEVDSALPIMMKNAEKIANLRKMMNDGKAIFDSSEYKMMAEQFEKIEKITKEIKENHPDFNNVSEQKIDALRDAYIEMSVKTENYIGLKKLVPSTTRGEKRLDFAKGLRDVANDTLEELGFNIDKEKAEEEEIETEKDNEMSL